MERRRFFRDLSTNVSARLLATTLAASTLVPGVAATTGTSPEATPAAHSAEPLKVMSFNIRYGTAGDGDNRWERRRFAVIRVIESFRPHVLGVQEALRFQLDQLATALPGYEEIGVGRSDGVEAGEYAAVLVDTSRLEVLDEGTFWFSDTPQKPGSTSWGNTIPRIATWARLRDRPAGTNFYLYNLHWDHRSQPSRERSAALLLERIGERNHDDEPVIVTGDFNAGESNPAFVALLEDTQVDLTDTFRALHPDAGGVGTFNGFVGTTSGEKIDAVLASPEWEIVASEIVRTAPRGRYPSDHFPVTATLRLGASR